MRSRNQAGQRSVRKRRGGQARDDITKFAGSRKADVGLASGKKRSGQGEELERDRRKRFTRELTDAGKGFLGGNELPVMRSGASRFCRTLCFGRSVKLPP